MLRSASIIGGAEAINYIVGLVRSKLVAVLLGPAGVGFVGLYVTTAAFLGILAQLGINQSGVREIADASTKGDSHRVAVVSMALRHACWFTGILGWGLTAAFALPLSKLVFGSTDQALALAIVGCTILLANIFASRMALLQGLRRLGDMARVQLSAALANTIMAVSIYAAYGEKAILPVIVLTGVIQLLASWFFARKIKLDATSPSAFETFGVFKMLLPLGISLMYTGLLVNAVGLGTRAIVFREVGEDAAGWYQAAWMLSGMFAGFIFSAMGTDFYPRLSGVIEHSGKANSMVNQQIEIGMLLAIPGLIGTLCFAPQLLEIFYSSQFTPAASTLELFVLGIFFRTLSWPVSFVLLAKRKSLLYGSRGSIAMLLQFVATVFLVRSVGFVGVGIAFIIGELLLVIMDTLISRRLTRFSWSTPVIRMLAVCVSLFAAGFALEAIVGDNTLARIVAGLLLSFAACVYSLRGLNSRLDSSHPLIRRLRTVPGVSFLLAPMPWARVLKRR
jgi:enterobacterial common antigen flippase